MPNSKYKGLNILNFLSAVKICNSTNTNNFMTSSEIRQQFLDFFKSKQHIIVPSAPIVVKNDPTLLFTNAGMNQFKDYFLGNKQPNNKRIVDTQKCLRVSGKHNDLEEVGVDTYHHTMFEMLGNWSFGDYFKKDAIAWSWELLTEVYKIPKENLYVTIFEGDDKEGLPKDEEAHNEWKKYVAEDHILLGNKKDNFWEMGDTGPCGPCTEIHADTRTAEEKKLVNGATLVNNDHPQVIEIWNNVFIQFNRKKDGSLEALPASHVDTGMGFERLVRVLQNKTSNYDTDVFTGTISATGNIVNKKYSFGDDKESVAFRVLADHIRAISFCIADGQLPSNTGAGYVIRRILRRAVRYYYSYLDYKQPLLFQLLPIIAEQFSSVFPELKAQQDFVAKVIKEEEEAFLRTLDKGLKRLDEYFTKEKNRIHFALLEKYPKVKEMWVTNFQDENNKEIWDAFGKEKTFKMENLIYDGKVVFELYDTYGFPLDLTKLIVSEANYPLANWTIDEDGFNKALTEQKNRSRAATAMDTEDWIIVNEGDVSFVGYDSLETTTKILRYRKVSGKGKELYQIVLEQTPFYAESGGQVGDSGQLAVSSGQGAASNIKIIDTKKENDLIIHFAETIPADLRGEVIATINTERRHKITIHHSVTHLMHTALRQVLGHHVAQKGSLVNDEYLRFDFSHFAKMTDGEIAQVEKIVNQKIRENIPVVIKSMRKDDAMKTGAMALFGEKYGDMVRVVTIDPNYSIELCGGTHVGNTGEIGFFKLRSESAVAAGVRRIEAVSGEAAEMLINNAFSDIDTVKALLKNPKEIGKAIEALQSENSSLQKRIESLEARQLVGIRNELLTEDEIINGVTFVGQIIEVPSADSLKKLCTDLKNHLHDHVVVLCANVGGKAHVAISISDTVVAAKNLDASKMIKETVSGLIQGGGGGQKNLATAGGQNVSGLGGVIDAVKNLL